jgi:predicted adenine nucleotide alpha hydrolase (AANH) superfamily ATPase
MIDFFKRCLVVAIIITVGSCKSENDITHDITMITSNLSLPDCFVLELINEEVETIDFDYSVEYIFRQTGCYTDFSNLSQENEMGKWEYCSGIWNFKPSLEAVKSNDFYEAIYLENHAVLYVVLNHN